MRMQSPMPTTSSAKCLAACATSSLPTQGQVCCSSTIASALSASGQVYLAAVIPDGSISFSDEVRTDPTRVVHEDWLGVDPTVDADAARHFLFHDCQHTVQAWALTTLRPFVPLPVYDEVLAAGGRPSMVIVPANDRTLRPDWMVTAAHDHLGAEPVQVDAGHCPHVSQPKTIADSITNFEFK